MSKLIETRIEFQQLAEQRLRESKALLDLGMWDGAYYLAGYAVELGLKACIIKWLIGNDAFPDKDFSRNCYTHDLEKLVVLAKLDGVFFAAKNNNPNLNANWIQTIVWSEEKRYHRVDQLEAEALYASIADKLNGVFPWIKTQW